MLLSKTHHINDLQQRDPEFHHDGCRVILDRSLQTIVVHHQVTVELPLVHTTMASWKKNISVNTSNQETLKKMNNNFTIT